MKASETNLLKFLKKSPQFVIPIYQRNYSWTEPQCKQLWADLLRAGGDENIKGHFIGSIVYIERGLSTVTTQEALLVIDGQQRLTTCTLLIAALAKHFEINNLGELVDGFSARKLKNYYLVNPEEDGDKHYKLILSENDKQTLLSIIKSVPMPPEVSIRIEKNYEFFQKLIEKHKGELEAVCEGLAKLLIVEISLDRIHDNPQLIFESMNSTGLDLSQADLIRNYILMGLEPRQQTELYLNYWRLMEKSFGQQAYVTHFDPFMRHYLTAKTGEIPNVREVYTAFKSFVHDGKLTVDELIADIHAYASYYCAMALGKEQNKKLKAAFDDLRELKVDVAYPFLLDVYHDYKQGRLDEEELLQVVRLVESYVFRRAVCAIPTYSLSKVFASLSRSLRKEKEHYLESVQAAFLLFPSYRRFPKDEEFEREFKQRDLYNFRSRSYWLRRLENYKRKEPIVLGDYTIEHIMPQNEKLSQEWQAELGSDWQQVQQKYLHTLGNLTLTGYNSEYSDRSFAYKRDQVSNAEGDKIGFKNSPLNINNGLGSVEKWDESAIVARAEQLAKKAIQVWAPPQLDAAVLDSYRIAVAKTAQRYSIDNHPFLLSGPSSILFEALRKEILELDPCIKEEFLKFYVAYKAETNFVDIVPQAKRLRLTLNMPFGELDDPKNRCTDLTGVGHWSNGDVEVFFESLDELAYLIGLIRQSFDHQMGAQ